MASIRQQRGSFQVRWRQEGKEVSETFGTRKQADKFKGLVDGHGQRYPDGWVPTLGWAKVEKSSDLLLREWFPRAMAARTMANERSKHDAIRDFGNHVPDWLADKPLDAITREDAGLWINELKTAPRGGKGKQRTKPLSYKTVHNVHGHVAGAVNDAVRDGLVGTNPFTGLLRGMPKSPIDEMVCLTPEEFVILRDAFIEHYHPFLTFLYGSGLRFSEATALGPEHFDLRRQSVRVNRAWKRNPEGGVYLGEPKTKRAIRTVTLNATLTQMVMPLIAAARARWVPGDPSLVFVNKTGGRIQNGSFHAHQWIEAVARAQTKGLTQRPRPHDLRHSHAALMLAEGNSMYAVSRRLGHASIAITDDRYSHKLPEVDEQMRDSLDRIPTFQPTGLRVVSENVG